MLTARIIRVRGIVQGVGFRPFVYRLARTHSLNGWVLNGEQGVEIFIEGMDESVETFLADLKNEAPPAAVIAELEVENAAPEGFRDFSIRESEHRQTPTVRISPDLPVCEPCLAELFDPANRRFHYPYINCTNCGPRYTVVLALPYDRPNTTMRAWPLDDYCASEYTDPLNRRFHAQPVACPNCGPRFSLRSVAENISDSAQAIARAAALLCDGNILAVKGLGGYHLASDARNAAAVSAMRERKYRKEKPFAVMPRDLAEARTLVELTPAAESLLISSARPIVLAPAKVELAEVAPANDELGVMLPYTPLQHLLFAAGAPSVLVMTSANRSSEPIAYEDDDALESLAGIADAFLIGERPIARRVDDSVARDGVFGPAILRRARGYAPGAVTTLPTSRPILALGADLKNTITLVVGGQAFVSQHIGDLEHLEAFRAFRQTIDDLLSMYEVDRSELLVVHDLHPQYFSTRHAEEFPVAQRIGVQHHRAHIASVLAERHEFDRDVIGISFDGTGFGDDGTIWGGEIFLGSLRQGFERVAHLRPASLPGGDAAARFPVQAAAGFLAQLPDLPSMLAPPFNFPARFTTATQLVEKRVRTFGTTSMGRLFDTLAALLGFTRESTFEGQAAMWTEQLARKSPRVEPYDFPFDGSELDFRPLFRQAIADRQRGRKIEEISRAFHRGIAAGIHKVAVDSRTKTAARTMVLSGGVFQNELLLEELKPLLESENFDVWVNQAVPPNDGGISLGQAAIAAQQPQSN